MKNNETDIDEGIDFSEKAFKKRFRRIERPAFLDKISREKKSRITIFLDADIVDFFKNESKNSDDGYQTLINSALRRIVDASHETLEKQTFKQEILNDKEFLRELKEALV